MKQNKKNIKVYYQVVTKQNIITLSELPVAIRLYNHLKKVSKVEFQKIFA